MAHYKGCPYCKGRHRTKRAFNACARRNGPRDMWPKLPR